LNVGKERKLEKKRECSWVKPGKKTENRQQKKKKKIHSEQQREGKN